MLKNKKQLYWILTISGWLLFGLFKSYLSPFWDVDDPNRWLLTAFTFVNPLQMILITHSYRYLARRFNWLNFSFPKTTIVIAAAAGVMIWLFIYIKAYVNPYIAKFFCWILNREYPELATQTPPALEPVMNYVYPYMFTLECAAFMIWLAFYHAYHFFENMQIKTAEQYESKVKLQEAELSFLRSQLNPHFLFNALNSIHALSLAQSERASDAVILLSDLMRYTLNYGKKNLVRLEEEMEIVEKYLKLEQIRFGKKLTYQFDIQENTLSVLIPPIIVQTLAENAIKHAIRQNTSGGLIRINTVLKDDFLIIDIVNNGQLTAKEAPSVSDPFLTDSDPKDGGIGIENTEKRLTMIYGDKAGFSLKNANNQEVVASLKIPLRVGSKS
jgi:two-component system, LytTR family, sensor kinase